MTHTPTRRIQNLYLRSSTLRDKGARVNDTNSVCYFITAYQLVEARVWRQGLYILYQSSVTHIETSEHHCPVFVTVVFGHHGHKKKLLPLTLAYILFRATDMLMDLSCFSFFSYQWGIKNNIFCTFFLLCCRLAKKKEKTKKTTY